MQVFKKDWTSTIVAQERHNTENKKKLIRSPMGVLLLASDLFQATLVRKIYKRLYETYKLKYYNFTIQGCNNEKLIYDGLNKLLFRNLSGTKSLGARRKLLRLENDQGSIQFATHLFNMLTPA